MDSSWGWLLVFGIGLVVYLMLKVRQKDPFEAPLPDLHSQQVKELKKRIQKTPILVPEIPSTSFKPMNEMQLAAMAFLAESRPVVCEGPPLMESISILSSQPCERRTGWRSRTSLKEAVVAQVVLDRPVGWR
jgi:hypothetical protein